MLSLYWQSGLGVGREGNRGVRGCSQGPRSMWYRGIGIQPGLGLVSGIKQDSRSAIDGVTLQAAFPMWLCGVRMKGEGTVTLELSCL